MTEWSKHYYYSNILEGPKIKEFILAHNWVVEQQWLDTGSAWIILYEQSHLPNSGIL